MPGVAPDELIDLQKAVEQLRSDSEIQLQRIAQIQAQLDLCWRDCGTALMVVAGNVRLSGRTAALGTARSRLCVILATLSLLSFPPSCGLPHLRNPSIAMAQPPHDYLDHRYVDIPCPSGKHQRSLVTFRNHAVAAMFCIPCEHAWTETVEHPLLIGMHRDETDRS